MTKEPELKSDCIEFTGFKDNQGYGVVSIGDVRIRAHRIAFKLSNPRKTLTRNMDVCHKCDNPSCINPDHLFLGTHGDNNRDRASKGRSASGEKHGRAKLKSFQVEEIRKMLKDGCCKSHIAEMFGVDEKLIRLIGNGSIWNRRSS